MHTYTETLWWVQNPKLTSVDEYHINLFLITTIDPTIGRHISSLCTELPTEIFSSAISVQLTAMKYDNTAGYDPFGIKIFKFDGLLPYPFDTLELTGSALTQCVKLQIVDHELQLGTNLRTYTKYDHSYLSSMTDNQILQHAISYGDNWDVRCAIDEQLSSRGKRIKSFIDGSIDKIVPISKPKVKVKVGLSKSELNTQKRRLQARFRHKVQKWIGSHDVEVNDWVNSCNADQMKNNKKFMKDVGWSINTLLEYEVTSDNVGMDNVLFSKADPKDYPELIAWWDSIVVD